MGGGVVFPRPGAVSSFGWSPRLRIVIQDQVFWRPDVNVGQRLKRNRYSQDLINHRGEIWQLALEQGWLPRELDLPLIARVEGRPGFWDEDSASLMTVLRIQTDVN